MSKTNDVIKLDSLPTDTGLLDKQGYLVYSIYGISKTITRDSGGPGHAVAGLYVVKSFERSEND